MGEERNKLSTLLIQTLLVGETYSLDEIALLLGVQTNAIQRKGVVTRQGTDVQLLLLHLRKDEFSTPGYEDHLVGSVLYWSGQNVLKAVEKALVNRTKETFVFIQEARKTPFVYYGRAYPLRMQINWAPGTPSHIIFDLYEYEAVLRQRKRSIYDSSVLENDPQYSLRLVDWDISTEKEKLTRIRIAQTLYRNNALKLWGNRCAVTTVDDTSWLVASHIKPWRESSDIERVDPFNSLILTPNFDKLFDRGVISFSPDTGKIILPETQSKTMWRNFNLLHIDENIKLQKVPIETSKYLEYHENCVFNFEPNSRESNEVLLEELVAKGSI